MGARLTARLGAIVLSIVVPASAQTKKPIVEVAGDRGGVDRAKLEDLVSLELGADAARIERVTIAVGDGRADVDVDLAGGERRRGSSALPAAEPARALALFVAELARGAPAAPPGEPAPPAPAPVVAPPVDRPAPPPPPAAEPWRLSTLGSMGARIMTTGGALLPTPRIEIGARREDVLRLGAIARYAYASAADPLGTVSAHAIATGAAGTYVLMASRGFALATGPRFEIGAALGSGRGANASATTAFIFAGSWEIEAHVKLGGATLFGALEGGSFVRGVELHADDRDVLHLSGPFAGAALGATL